MTKQLTLNPGCAISYQRHNLRDKIWTFIDGEIVIDANRHKISCGETVIIPKCSLHALRATITLTFIEVQTGSNLIKEDIEHFDNNW